MICLNRLSFLVICLVAFISPARAAGTNTKVWTDPVTKDELTTIGWEWHDIRKEFYENFTLTKNVFEFFPRRRAQISLRAEKANEKLKDYSFSSLESTGYSLYLFFGGEEIVAGSSLISDLSEHRTVFELNKWQRISNEFEVEKDEGLPTTENLLKFDFQMKFTYASNVPKQMKNPYLAISRLQKYYKFSRGFGDNGERVYDIVFFNFTKNNTDYLVEVDGEPVDLKDLKHWTNLNFPGVVKHRIKDLAVSKLNDSYMLLTFNIKSKEEHFENSAICLTMKYYHDVHNNAQNTFGIVSQARDAEDKKVFNKLLEYCSFRTNANDVKQKNWLDLRYCISKQFFKHNLIYLVSTLDEGSQLSLFPDLTAAIADLRIERKTENLNDFLYAWSTGTFDPHDEWYTTPVVDNFGLRRVEGTNQTYLELINDQNSKIDVYYLVSNSFGLTNNMRLTFNINNNHSEAATLKIYLVEDTEKRRLIGRIDLNQVSEEKYSYSFNLTDSVYESNRAFSAIDMDEEYVDRFERLANREKNRDKGELEKDKDKEEAEKEGTTEDKTEPETEAPNPEPKPDPGKPDEMRPQRAFAKLIFEFTLKHFLEENDSPEKLTLYNVNLMDPCYQNIDQCKLGKCISDAVDKWHCQCDENAHGKVHCEFHDMCKSKLTKQYIEKHQLIVSDDAADTLTGNLYCAQRKAKGCSPIDNRILCVCEEGEYWNYKAQSCQKIDACSYVYCSENEECYLDRQTKKPKCRCKFNYYRNESTDRCEADYCRGEKINKLYCSPTQDCLNDLVNGRPVCDCKFGFTRQGADCSAWFTNNLPKSPFVNQYYGCDHTYELSNDKQLYLCRCFEGWKLQEDQRTCKAKFDTAKCPECSFKQICVLTGADSNQTTCTCKVGHQGENREECERDFCNEPSMKRLVRKSCVSSEACSLYNVRTQKPIFHCGCPPGLSNSNKQNGICELKNVCNKIEQDKCAKTDGYCVPRVLSGILTAVCECSIGFDKDENGKCVPLDQLVDCKKYNAFTKYIDVSGDRAVCSCLPGYSYEPAKKKCVLSPKDTVHVSVVVFLKHLTDELDREEIPGSSYSNRLNQANKFKIFDCNAPNSKLPNKEHCYSLINAAYKPLVELNRTLMMKNVEYQLYQKVRALFYAIQGDEDLSISMISYENLTAIDENEYGFNAKYQVNIALVSGMIGGDVLQDNLDKMCQEREQETEEKSIKSNEFKGFCFLDKQLLPISRKLKVVGSLNLCNLKTMQCPAYSSCRHELISQANQYSCVCNKGFKSLHRIEEFNLNIEVCEDVDECSEAGAQHDCGPNTDCDNLIGSYRCVCKKDHKMINATDCEKTCSNSFPCVNGECQSFKDFYEICECYDGYKGADCSKEDSLVILLKTILVFVSVGLGLMLVVVIAIAVFCIKSVRKQRRKDEDHQICLDDLK